VCLVPDRPDDAWLHLSLIADAYERGGWPAPLGRIRPLAALRGRSLAVPLLDGTWRRDIGPDPVAHAHTLGNRAVVATTARVGFGALTPVRSAHDIRFGPLTVSACPHPRRIVVTGPNLPAVEIVRHGPGEDIEPADPIGTRRADQLGLTMNGRQGALLPRRGGSGRSGYDVAAAVWSRRYDLRQTGPAHAEILRNELRVARLLRGDPAPDRRYAVGWDPVADAIDRAVVHALASAFRIGATTLRERVRAARRHRTGALASPGWVHPAEPGPELAPWPGVVQFPGAARFPNPALLPGYGDH